MPASGGGGKYVPLKYVREQLLKAAAELLEEASIAPPHPVTFRDAIARAGVPRSSAYRAFDVEGMDPQDAFTHALIRRVSGPAISGDDQERDRGLDMMMELDDVDPEQLAWVFQEYARLAGADFGEAMMASSGARLFTMALLSEQTPELQETVRDVEEALGEDPLDGLDVRPVLDLCGLRVIPSVGDWAAARTVLSVGLASFLQPAMAIEGRFADLPTGPDGDLQPWTLGGLLLMGFGLMTLEPDPEAEVSADLSLLRFPPGRI
ncbi:MAG: hypothetical protein AAF962_07170 [Actinomycetota bacterium]